MSPERQAAAGVKEIVVTARVRRRDGSYDDLGVISGYTAPWPRRLWWALAGRLRRLRRPRLVEMAGSLWWATGRGFVPLFAGGADVITNAGLAIITNKLKASGTEPNFLGIGTGAGTAAVGDTALFTEVETRVAGTSSRQLTTVANDTYRVVSEIAITATRSITNSGLLDAITSGNLFEHSDFATIGLSAGEALEITTNIVFADV